MEKRRLGLHTVTILAIVLFAILAIGSTASAPRAVAETGIEFENRGTFGESVIIPVKDFESRGLVFTQVRLVRTERARSGGGSDVDIEGNVLTYQALLREAHNLGADAIINVVIDTVETRTTTGTGNNRESVIETRWFGSALAIRYTGLIENNITVNVIRDPIIAPPVVATEPETPATGRRAPIPGRR